VNEESMARVAPQRQKIIIIITIIISNTERESLDGDTHR
jgi:hypothetical protein